MNRTLNRHVDRLVTPVKVLFGWLFPEPELWAVAERDEHRYLKVLTVYRSRDLAMADMAHKIQVDHRPVTVMRHLDVQKWNDSLDLFSDWEGEDREPDQ